MILYYFTCSRQGQACEFGYGLGMNQVHFHLDSLNVSFITFYLNMVKSCGWGGDP